MQDLSDCITFAALTNEGAVEHDSGCTNPKLGKMQLSYHSKTLNKRDASRYRKHLSECRSCGQAYDQHITGEAEVTERFERNARRYAEAEEYMSQQRAREDLELRLDEDYLRAKEAGEW